MSPSKSLRIMLLIAAVLVAIQVLFLMTNILPASFEDFGAFSTGTISIILLQIVILSCIVGYVTWRTLLDKDWKLKNPLNFTSVMLFFIGLILSIEGLVAINLNQSIITGSTSMIMIFTGLMLYMLGVLSMVTFVQNERVSSLHISTPFFVIIVFTLLMLPPVFLLA